MSDSNRAMPSDSTKTLVFVRGGFISRWRGQKSTIFVSRKKSRRCLPGGGVTTSQRTSTACLAGNKNRGFLTPPTQHETSSRKSSSVLVESNDIVQLLLLVQYISSRESKLRGASEHPHE